MLTLTVMFRAVSSRYCCSAGESSDVSVFGAVCWEELCVRTDCVASFLRSEMLLLEEAAITTAETEKNKKIDKTRERFMTFLIND